MTNQTPEFAEGSLVTAPDSHGDMVFEVDETWLDEDTGERCYYVSNNQYMSKDFAEIELKQFMSAEDASQRRLPTPDEFVKAYDWLHDPWDGNFTLHASDPDGEGQVQVAGKTDDGLFFVALVKVLDIQPADF